MKKLQLKNNKPVDEKQKYINLFRLSVDNPKYHRNTPDEIFFIDYQTYNDKNTVPFIFLRFNGENKLFYGPNGTIHLGILAQIHSYLMSKGYKPSDITGCKSEDEYINTDFIKQGKYLDSFDEELMIKGRYFLVDVPVINQKCAIFGFWFIHKYPMALTNEIIYQVCKERKIFDRRIYIANGSKPLIDFNAFSPGPSEEDIEDNSKQAILHMMNAKDKNKATADFRKTRDSLLGKKLTMSNGKEMPMAQYNALKYVDESTVNKPKRIIYMTEEQINHIKKELLNEITIYDKYIKILQPTTENKEKEEYKLVNENKKIIYLTENQVSEIQKRLEQARSETNTNPTEKQKEAGNYKMGRITLFGFNIAIENPKGSIRRGQDKNGKKWQIRMNNDYGYFTHTKAIDGDAVDVFLGNDLSEENSVFAIDQKLNGKFDETKVMLGFKTEEEAKNAYLSNYQKGWKGFWKITEVSLDVFKEWLYDGYKQRKPFFEYVDIQKKKLNENVDFYKKNKFKLSGENLSDFAHVISETFDEVISEYENNGASKILTKENIEEFVDNNELQDVMGSFDVQKQLNPKFWVNGKLNSRVRLRLLDIADAFFDSLDVNWVKPKDIILTGSLANYNWSKYSDIDLHIVINFKDVDERVEFVKSYFDSKKKLWNEEHEDLTIYGFPVELYVQDENEEHTASGIYSLERDKWLREPEMDDLAAIKLDKETVVDKTKKIADKIEGLEKACEQEKDSARLDILSNKVKKLFDRIKGMRKQGLKSSELGTGNIIFKCLRRLGYIGRLVDLKRLTFDKINSIK